MEVGLGSAIERQQIATRSTARRNRPQPGSVAAREHDLVVRRPGTAARANEILWHGAEIDRRATVD
jgi:hypothetical protein